MSTRKPPLAPTAARLRRSTLMPRNVMPAGTMRTVSSHTGGQYERGELERNTPYNPDVEVTDSRESGFCETVCGVLFKVHVHAVS